jgi:hypothetical protein
MLQTTTLKKNLVTEIEEARKKVGFGFPRWLPPLKETFVGSLDTWVSTKHLGVNLALGHPLTWHWVIL